MANHPTGVMCAGLAVSFSQGAMTVAATTPLLAIAVLAWIMIGLPIILVLIAAVAYLIRPTEHRGDRASRAGVERGPPRPTDPTGRDRRGR